jgi:hypothetical protein
MKQQTAALDTIWQRLLARHEAIERQLEAVLRRAGLTRAALHRAARHAPATEPRIAPEPAAEVGFEELSRPSLEEISKGRSWRLLRV